MAIKGKGRTKAGRKAPARGPRPGFVEPPKPVWRRRWFLGTLIGVAVAGVAAIVLSIVLITHSNNQKKAKEIRVGEERIRVQRFALPVIGAIQGIVSTPGGTLVQPFPDLPTRLSDLQAGKLSPADATAAGKLVVTQANGAIKAIQGIDVAGKVVSGFPDLLPLIDSQEYLVQSLKVYAQVGTGLQLASDATGAQRKALVAQYTSLVSVASDLFTQGYQKIVNAQTATGLPPNQFPPTPSPTPSASPSPTPSASPSASAKPSPKTTGTKKGSSKHHSPKPSPSKT